MSKFRTAALGAVVVLGFAGVAGAQARPDTARMRGRMEQRGMMGQRGDRMGPQHDRLMKELNLTDAQRARVKAIHAKYEPQFKALRDQERAQVPRVRDARQKGDTTAAARARFRQQRQQFRQRLNTIRQQEQNEVRAVLTADQRAKFDASRAQMEARMKQRRDSMKNGRGPARKNGKA